jgi:sulfoxide reductase heme-binding subunit YedZ
MLIWYLARGAGMAGFAALSVATGAGAFASRRTAYLDRRVVWQYVHRAAALSGVVLLVSHVILLLLDSFANVGVLGALVPFASGYRPWQVTLGLVSMYVIVTLSVTGLLRSKFAASERAAGWWRVIHLGSYAAWAMAALHFLVTGTDSGTWWALAVLFAGIAVVGCGVIARLVDGPAVAPRTRAPLGSAPAARANSYTVRADAPAARAPMGAVR